ncbi:hypothetical protein HY623_02745 [Candidatus Uhrbacteria bacterium]|nr:hypothetical protein [Candidatus Uhrbacteria bacterium]
MENVIYGIQALGRSVSVTVIALLHHQLIWGFGLGFLASTFIHLFIVTDIPRAIPLMVTKSAPDSFQKIASRDEHGSYTQSYTTFQKEHSRVRIAFYLALNTLLLVILLALLRG